MVLCAAAALGLTAPPAAAACTLDTLLIPCIEMSVPASADLGTLDAGTTGTSADQSLVVSSNQSWGVKVASDAATGRMREWTGSAYAASPATLTNPLEWALTSVGGSPRTPSWAPASSSQASVVSGRPATGCTLGALCGTETIQVRYRQSISFSDRRVAPNRYRVRLTYTAQHGF